MSEHRRWDCNELEAMAAEHNALLHDWQKAVDELAALRQPATRSVKVRWDVTADQAKEAWLKTGSEYRMGEYPRFFMDYLAAHAVLDVPPGVPGVKELAEIGERAFADDSDYIARAAAIRDAVLAGMVAYAQKPLAGIAKNIMDENRLKAERDEARSERDRVLAGVVVDVRTGSNYEPDMMDCPDCGKATKIVSHYDGYPRCECGFTDAPVSDIGEPGPPTLLPPAYTGPTRAEAKAKYKELSRKHNHVSALFRDWLLPLLPESAERPKGLPTAEEFWKLLSPLGKEQTDGHGKIFVEFDRKDAARLLSALTPWLRAPVAWELDVTAEEMRVHDFEWLKSGNGGPVRTIDQMQNILDLCRSRIRPVYECPKYADRCEATTLTCDQCAKTWSETDKIKEECRNETHTARELSVDLSIELRKTKELLAVANGEIEKTQTLLVEALARAALEDRDNV